MASAEDMIILKLLSLRERDVDDIKELLTQKLDFGYLKQTAQKLGVLDLLQEYL
ncbi:MAG: DUF6036 family nucleotidyltransferase [Elusimicrobiota bacterium]|nr:DUF6036 family nucleotidyltransferase [Elusimicrobiota bacterium]